MLQPALVPRTTSWRTPRVLGCVLLALLLATTACATDAPQPPSQGELSVGDTVRGENTAQSSVRSRAKKRRHCDKRPSRCGYPDASNTGVPAGVKLKASGPINASRDGQVIKNKDVRGEINVTASNVTIKNTRVTGGRGIGPADWVVIIRPGAENLTIVDSEIRTPAGSQQDIACVFNIGDTRPFLQRVDISGCSAGVSSGAAIVKDSFIHHMARVPGLSHDVGIASNGGGGLVVRHNTIFNQYDQTAAVAMYQDFGGQRNNVVAGNLLAGGGYCVYGGKGAEQTSRIRFVNNRFSRRYHRRCGYFGVVASFDRGAPGNKWERNYWDHNLKTVRR